MQYAGWLLLSQRGDTWHRSMDNWRNRSAQWAGRPWDENSTASARVLGRTRASRLACIRIHFLYLQFPGWNQRHQWGVSLAVSRVCVKQGDLKNFMQVFYGTRMVKSGRLPACVQKSGPILGYLLVIIAPRAPVKKSYAAAGACSLCVQAQRLHPPSAIQSI